MNLLAQLIQTKALGMTIIQFVILFFEGQEWRGKKVMHG